MTQEPHALQLTDLDAPSAKQLTGTQERIVSLLGAGLAQEEVAKACGVDASYISQLLSRDEIAQAVGKLRYEKVKKHTARDDSYDALEDRALEYLGKSLSLIACKPMELLKTVQVLNQAKRRTEGVTGGNDGRGSIVVQLTLPTKIIQKFSVNVNNQVIGVKIQEQGLVVGAEGEVVEGTVERSQELVTIQSGRLEQFCVEHAAKNKDLRPEKALPSVASEPLALL